MTEGHRENRVFWLSREAGLSDHPSHANHAHPRASVPRVIGSPARKYWRKPICTTGLAVSTTMILATLPVIVRLPARVDAIARSSQAWWGLGNEGTKDFSSMTAGTLLTILLSAAVAAVNAAGPCRLT